MIETPHIHTLQAANPMPPGERLWTAALEQTRGRSPASFEQWFSSVQYDGFETGLLSLTARDEFVRDWVKAHFLPDLLSHLARLSGESNPASLRVKWNISNRLARPVLPTAATELGSTARVGAGHRVRRPDAFRAPIPLFEGAAHGSTEPEAHVS